MASKTVPDSAVCPKVYDLFGGAIQVNLPNFLMDISQVRQVPDSQEVFVSTSSPGSSTSELSVIVEVLQKLSAPDPITAVRLHFDSLAHDNSAQSQTVLNTSTHSNPSSIPDPPPAHPRSTPQPVLLEGIQTISKFNRPAEEADEVHIWMALWTLDGVGNGGVGTDLVLTINLPKPDRTTSQAGPIQETTELFHQAANSLKIVDWNLFA